MPLIFGTSSDSPRGCFMAFAFDGQNSKGALLTLPDGELLTNPDPTWPLVVTGVRTNFVENSQFLKCFNDKIYTYAFGGDVGSMVVDFVGFLQPGTEAGSRGGGVTDDPWTIAFDAYNNARLSRSVDYATLTLGSKALQGLVTQLGTSTQSPNFGLQTFSLTMAYLPEIS
jgi:hypothetical protein